MNFNYIPTFMSKTDPQLSTVKSDSTWQELAIALARKLTVYSNCYPNEEIRDESLQEGLYLTDKVWAKQSQEETKSLDQSIINDVA